MVVREWKIEGEGLHGCSRRSSWMFEKVFTEILEGLPWMFEMSTWRNSSGGGIRVVAEKVVDFHRKKLWTARARCGLLPIAKASIY
jgi:hypothetical protein